MTAIMQMRNEEEAAAGANRGWFRVALLFLAAVVGVLASLFLPIAKAFMALPVPEQTLAGLLGLAGLSPLGLLVQLVVGFVIVGVVFPLIYVKIPLNTTEAPALWFFLAFQNGAFADALFGQVAAGFTPGGNADATAIIFLDRLLVLLA